MPPTPMPLPGDLSAEVRQEQANDDLIRDVKNCIDAGRPVANFLAEIDQAISESLKLGLTESVHDLRRARRAVAKLVAGSN